jgi:hypothetical protein
VSAFCCEEHPIGTLAFGTWKQETSAGRVLRPDTRDEKWREFADEFEREMAEAKADASGKQAADDQPERSDVVAGVEVNGAAKAYPLSALDLAFSAHSLSL